MMITYIFERYFSHLYIHCNIKVRTHLMNTRDKHLPSSHCNARKLIGMISNEEEQTTKMNNQISDYKYLNNLFFLTVKFF
jgi:hypothetical protein